MNMPKLAVLGTSNDTALELFLTGNVKWPQGSIGRSLYSSLSPIIENETYELAKGPF